MVLFTYCITGVYNSSFFKFRSTMTKDLVSSSWWGFLSMYVLQLLTVERRPKVANPVQGVLPAKLPSIGEIKKVIPRHCFESSVTKSMSYVCIDIVAVVCLYIVAEVLRFSIPPWMFIVVTPIYWQLQGTMFMAIFVLGHDCGHGSFSSCDLLNDTIGTALHSFLLVPFYPWKVSHKNHHKFTGNIDKDEVFYPVRKRLVNGKVVPGFALGFGWFIYLMQGYKPRSLSHFNPLDPMFRNHVVGCTLSLVGYTTWITCLYVYAREIGICDLMYHYVAPLLVFATWMVMVTFLHHCEVNVPWYSDNEWDFVRGQLSSIDRDYGWAHSLIHEIGTHQIHHLFSKVPHYHLKEATSLFREAFPELIRYDGTPIIPAFIKMFRKFDKQSIIPDETAIHMYT